MDLHKSPNIPLSTETLSIGIQGMTCDHCARRVEKALRAEPGVREVRVDRSAAQATVTFDKTVIDAARLREALRKSGYPPTAG